MSEGWTGDKVMDELLKQGQREYEDHISKIEFIDISGQVRLLSELETGISPDSLDCTPDGTVYGLKDSTELVRLPRAKNPEIQPVQKISSFEKAAAVRLAASGLRLAVANKDGEVEVIDSNLATEVQVHRTLPFNFGREIEGYDFRKIWFSFGFSLDGRFVNLEPDSTVTIEGETLTQTWIQERRFFRDRPRSIDVKARSLVVAGAHLLLDELLLDENHAYDLDMRSMGAQLLFNEWGDEPGFIEKEQWYYARHRVVDLSQVNPMEQIVLERTFHTGSEMSRGMDPRGNSPRVSVHPNGYMSSVDTHQNDRADLWYGLPIYERVVFYDKNGEQLGEVRADREKVNDQAIAVNESGTMGFIGKNDGTVELVGLKDKPNAGQFHARSREALSVSEHDGRTTLAFESHIDGEPYPERHPPKSITQWKAHESSVKRVYSLPTGDRTTLVTVDSNGNAKTWHVPHKFRSGKRK